MPSQPSRPWSAVSAWRLVSCLALMAAIAALGGAVTAPAIPGWYRALAKPAWTPPDWVFPVVWPVLYLMMALALFRLWDRAAEGPARRAAIGLFLTQLALNAMWSPVFFGLKAPEAGVMILFALLLALAFAVRGAFLVDRPAGWLLVPYAGWVCYASTLNVAIAILN